MTIKGFYGSKLRLVKKRISRNYDWVGATKIDRLTLMHGNKVLCNIHVGKDLIHIFPKGRPDTFVRLGDER